MKIERLLHLAKLESYKSTYHQPIGAIFINGNKILSRGYNQSGSRELVVEDQATQRFNVVSTPSVIASVSLKKNGLEEVYSSCIVEPKVGSQPCQDLVNSVCGCLQNWVSEELYTLQESIPTTR